MTAPTLIGIAGGTGSGKTTVAQNIVASLPRGESVLIQHDWYYRDRSHMTPAERDAINFDEPDALENELLAGHLRQLKGGKAVDCPQYDFATHTRAKAVRRVEPARVIVVEGILLFSMPVLRDTFDLRLFVDTDDDIRLMRRLKRDMEERGRDLSSVEKQYFGTVRPMHRLHVEPTRQHAHLLIPEGGDNTQALEVIVGRLQFLLRGP